MYLSQEKTWWRLCKVLVSRWRHFAQRLCTILRTGFKERSFLFSVNFSKTFTIPGPCQWILHQEPPFFYDCFCLIFCAVLKEGFHCKALWKVMGPQCQNSSLRLSLQCNTNTVQKELYCPDFGATWKFVFWFTQFMSQTQYKIQEVRGKEQ